MILQLRSIKVMRKYIFRLAMAAVLAALVFAPFSITGCGSDSPSSKSGAGSTPERFVLKNIYNKNYKWSDFKGRPFIVNFWATWCGPCRREIPDMIKVYNDYQSQGLEIVAISLDDARTVSRVPAFVDRYRIPWIVLYGDEKVVKEFELGSSIPTTLFFDANGNEVNRLIGAQPELVFRREIDKLFSQSPSI